MQHISQQKKIFWNLFRKLELVEREVMIKYRIKFFQEIGSKDKNIKE